MRRVHNLVIGAGPAGLQLAYLLGQQGQDYLVLEKGQGAGHFFERYPRHRRLLSINKRHTGYPDLESRRRYDWNSLLCDDEDLQFPARTKEYFPSPDELVEYLRAFAQRHVPHVEYGQTVTRVKATEDGFDVSIEPGQSIRCARLFIATGIPEANTPSISGVELCENYDRFSVDPDDYLDQRVFILGKGNSAFETADNLIATTRKIWVCGSRTVRLAWGTHYVGDLRAVNNNFLDTYQLKTQNNILDGTIRAVRRDEERDELVVSVWFDSRQRLLEYRCDRVLLCTGFHADFDIFDSTSAPKRRSCNRLPLMTCEWESINVPNMFFAGTLMQSRDYRKTMSAFIHGFRHNIDSLVRILAMRDGAREWPGCRHLPSSSVELGNALIERLSTSASLLLQPGFLSDVVLVGANGAAEYLTEVPVDYARERILPNHESALVVTLEYGKHEAYMDPFAMPRGVGVEEDFYLHPILRHYERGKPIGRFWLPDELDNDWRTEPEHLEALCRWLDATTRNSTAAQQAMQAGP